MVTSTSTPGSMLMEVICLTISDGLCRSIRRLWILIWKRSQVLEPSPQGVFLVVMRRVWRGTEGTQFSLSQLKKDMNPHYPTRIAVALIIKAQYGHILYFTSSTFMIPGNVSYISWPIKTLFYSGCTIDTFPLPITANSCLASISIKCRSNMNYCTLVGMRTGPFTFRFFSLAPRIRSAQTEDNTRKLCKISATSNHFLVLLKKPWLRIAYKSRQGSSQQILSSLLRSSFHFKSINNLNLITLLQRLDVAAGEGDADAVDGDLSLDGCLASVL